LIIYILVTVEIGSFFMERPQHSSGRRIYDNYVDHLKSKTDSLPGNGVPGIHSQLHKSETPTSGGEDQEPSQEKSCSHA
jgi:hypothetical protein